MNYNATASDCHGSWKRLASRSARGTRIRCRSCVERLLLRVHSIVSVARIHGRWGPTATLLLTLSGLQAKVRHYAAGTEVLCFIVPANGTENHHYVALRKCWETLSVRNWD